MLILWWARKSTCFGGAGQTILATLESLLSPPLYKSQFPKHPDETIIVLFPFHSPAQFPEIVGFFNVKRNQ